MNKKGITLTILVITIALMLILVSVGANVTTNLIDKAKEQKVVANMFLIQTQVKIIMERVAFSGDTSYYIGTRLKDSSNIEGIANGVLTESELAKNTIYIYNSRTLDSLGLTKIELNSDEVFLVDYSNAEVIFPKGFKKEDGSMIYRISEAGGNLETYSEENNVQVVTFEAGTNYIEAKVCMNNSESNITDYQFLIATTEAGINQETAQWQKNSNYRFTGLYSNTNYFIKVKIKTKTGAEQSSKIYRVKTQ